MSESREGASSATSGEESTPSGSLNVFVGGPAFSGLFSGTGEVRVEHANDVSTISSRNFFTTTPRRASLFVRLNRDTSDAT